MATKKIQILDYNIKQSENSDTLDGKHASDFASASDMTTAKSNIGELQTKVGDKSVSSQISTAIASKADTDHTHTKSEVGLGNVDNTADADKSVKYATSAGSAASVTGIVGIKHGGTGSSTRSGSLCALINGGRQFTGDINTLTDTGVYWINLSNCTNGPASSGYGTMEVISYEVFLQRFTFYYDGIVYCRTYTNSQWYDWREIFGVSSTVPISSGGTGASNAATARQNLGAMEANPSGIELGESLPSTAAHGGYIDFHYNGSTKDYTTRLIETAAGTLAIHGNMDVTGWVQCSNGLWIAHGGFYANNNNDMVYGTSLPTAGNKGRIFFKKA